MAKLIGYDFNFFFILAYSPNIGKESLESRYATDAQYKLIEREQFFGFLLIARKAMEEYDELASKLCDMNADALRNEYLDSDDYAHDVGSQATPCP